MTRPVLPVLLIGTLLLAAVSLDSGDADTRNLLLSGVVSLSSAAAAFYFASSAATEARRDLLSATVEHQQVPNLVGMTIEQARATVSGVRLALVLPDPVSPLGTGIASQDSLCRGRRGRGSDRAGLRVTRTVGRSGPGSAAWSDPAGPPTDRAAGRPVTAA
jgi:hypothetical protein